MTLFDILRRLKQPRAKLKLDRRQSSSEDRELWAERREKEKIERRLDYLEAQAEVLARRDIP